MLEQVYTHCLRRYLVIPYCLEGAAVGGVDKQHYEQYANSGYCEGEQSGIESREFSKQV